MASNIRSSGTAALRYASALVDLAMEQGIVSQIQQDVADLRAMIASSPDFQTLIRSPLLASEEQEAGLIAIADAAKLSPLMKNFLRTLAANRRTADADAILKAVQENLAARRGEVKAEVESAADLSASQKKSLEESLSKTIGHPVAVTVKINKDLIGGMVVTLGSLQIDDSVKSKLDRLSLAMKYSRAAA